MDMNGFCGIFMTVAGIKFGTEVTKQAIVTFHTYSAYFSICLKVSLIIIFSSSGLNGLGRNG